ncbi:MAG: glycosyltransferase [Bradyrhizobium sp.]|uniref:glycosyltransferase family 2 protein n=1 Tax=Bradyrhizobium sp. TaxID=376 RepID=UPI0025BEEE35|nr:glycosyltransferase family 2 protein [Bradyrhizobium sp.]MBI5263541.1 glycosyltransferase [Bradyrhizobium sp.]
MNSAELYLPEFRSRRRHIPHGAMVFLSAMIIVYAAVLAIVLPWTAIDALGYGFLPAPMGAVLILYGTTMLLRGCVVHTLSCYEHVRRISRPVADPLQFPFVSILVPAYNEGDTIVSAVESLLALNYPHYEIIVVDDGSEDDTYLMARTLIGDHDRCRVRVIRKLNGGKWSALNRAFQESEGDLLLCVDADSRVGDNALQLMVPWFDDPTVYAVSGQVTIRNRVNALTRFQAAEYLLGNGGMRTALSFLGLVTVVPGPIGLYRRDALTSIAEVPWNSSGEDGMRGPFSGATFAEDFELSLSALAIGGRVIYEPRAQAYTKCPTEITSLLNQRYRWMRGTMQVFRRYMREMRPTARTRNRPLDALMLGAYPIDVYVAPLMNFLFWAFVAVAAGTGFSLELIASWIAAVMLLNVMAASVYVLAHDDDFSLLPYALLMDLYQCVLVNSAWVIALIDEIRGARMRWS